MLVMTSLPVWETALDGSHKAQESCRERLFHRRGHAYFVKSKHVHIVKNTV